LLFIRKLILMNKSENKTMKVTFSQLNEIIKEGVKREHRKVLIENRLEQINQELNALNNPEAWQAARDNAQAELEKKTINWKSVTQRSNGLLSERESTINEKWSGDAKMDASEKGKYKGKTITDLEKMLSNVKKTGPHKKGSEDYERQNELEFAIRAKKDWGKVKQESVSEIMSRAANLMAEAKAKYNNISK